MFNNYIFYFIVSVLAVYLTIKLLKNLDKEMNDCDVHCSCYLERESLEKQKEKYYKEKEKREEKNKN